jgi:choloylglycine hydrolase
LALASPSSIVSSVVLIDEALINDIPRQELAGSRVVTIDPGRDAIDQISAGLAGMSEIDVVRVISHGSDGALWFGDQRIDTTTLATRADEIAGWGRALAADADLLLYGCSVASTGEGSQFVRTLAGLTGADTAANGDMTGLTGDVTLDFQVGDVTHAPQATAECYAQAGVTLCTRVLWNTLTIDNVPVVLSGRSQDWMAAPGATDPSEPKLLVMPRGLRKSGAKNLDQVVVTENPATWTSSYGSVVVANENRVVMEGMNEKGLSAHALAQSDTWYGVRDPSRPGIQMGLMVPYILDNAATVGEAIALIQRVQPVSVKLDGYPIYVSFVIEDRLGNSAVIEYLKSNLAGNPSTDPGVVKIFQGRDVRVFANVDYEDSLAKLKNYNFDVTKDTRNTDVPGNGGRLFRFVRASFFSAYLQDLKPENIGQARAALMSVMRVVSNPIGAPGDSPVRDNFFGDETNWRTISDLTHGVYMFDNARTLATFTTDLKRLDFRPGSGVRGLDPGITTLNGDVTRLYRPFRLPVPGVDPSKPSPNGNVTRYYPPPRFPAPRFGRS